MNEGALPVEHFSNISSHKHIIITNNSLRNDILMCEWCPENINKIVSVPQNRTAGTINNTRRESHPQ